MMALSDQAKKVSAIVGGVMAILALSGAAVRGGMSFDARYEHLTSAIAREAKLAQALQAQQSQETVRNLQTDLRIYQTQLRFLSNKVNPTVDDVNEMATLRTQIDIITKRLAELQ